MLLQCFNISSNFQPMRSTFLPCWTKTFQHVRLEPELLLWLPEFRPSSWVANSRKRPFSLSRTLLPHSSVEAPAGYPYKNSNNRKKKERERARKRAGDDAMDARSLFLSDKPFHNTKRLLWRRDACYRGKLEKTAEIHAGSDGSCWKIYPTLRIILYPMDSVTGWVIDYIVTDFIRNRMIRSMRKMFFHS